ncbi:hypothetical protein [Tichowtungia aerotolerans]|uniref:Glycosyltransferase RgtA/B/C/D-like domain-containing protein n=1 Tax=Tichowtungia aerotolerans TaxID=2697043 RepID=A0A6P1M2J5_9BACT|nr:hypothetical protein [Tichowtungia aerotolerans]QHI68071.1 hypothetical protein GT409_00915 [Tichowtungia aerotolerans]
MKRTAWIFLVLAAVALSVLLSTANLFLGDLNQDEGWYLYAARQVTEGRVLYRDFMFTQGPALPYVYGVLFPIIGKLGVAGGRMITALFGLAAAGCAAWLAGRISSKYWKQAASGPSDFSSHWKVAAFSAFALAGVNVYQSYFTTIVKTYGLCAFFLTAGFVALSYSDHKRGAMASFWGGFLLALAACTRLSAGVALPIAGLWLVCNRKKVYPFGEGTAVVCHPNPVLGTFQSAWFAFGLGGGFVLLVGLVGFFFLAPESTHFALFGYHAGRSPGGLLELAALKVGFVSRFVQAYFVLAAGCAAAFLFRRHQRHVRRAGEEFEWEVRPRLTELLQQANQAESPFAHSFISLLWMVGAGVSLVHFSAPFPYDDYQVIIYPVLCVALVCVLVPRLSEKYQIRTAWAVLLVCAAASFSSPINQDWMVRGRDRIWWKFKEAPDLAVLQKAGAEIREKLGEGGFLLTQDTYLAVEAGARVPHGMEMGPFCYYPDMPHEQAEQFNLLNREMMIETLSKGRAPLAAFSGYGLTIESPGIGELSSEHWRALRSVLEKSYRKTSEIPDFGQAHTTLEIFERIPKP